MLWSNSPVNMTPNPVDPADRDAVVALLCAYADAIDDGDFEGVATLLAEAVVETADGTVVAEGRDAVLALYRSTTRRHADGTPRTAHLVTNIVVVPGPQPDELVVRSRFVVLQATGTLPLQPVVAGRYVDTFARRAGEWRFARRRMVPALWGDVSDHLTFQPE